MARHIEILGTSIRSEEGDNSTGIRPWQTCGHDLCTSWSPVLGGHDLLTPTALMSVTNNTDTSSARTAPHLLHHSHRSCTDNIGIRDHASDPNIAPTDLPNDTQCMYASQ